MRAPFFFFFLFGRATRAHCELHLLEMCSAGVDQHAAAAAASAAAASAANDSGGEGLNNREVNVLASLRDLFALSVLEQVGRR